jgi:DNA-binding transcriptional LysR family regulator
MGNVVTLRPLSRTQAATAQARRDLPAHGRALVRAPELAELRAFCAAIDLGSIGRAARYMGVSQPALSKRLQALEEVAGTKLLERSSRGVTTTPAGAQLHEAALRVLDNADAVENVIMGFSTKPAPVRVAASPTVADGWLPDVLVDLRAGDRARLAVEIVTANSCVVRQMIHDGHSDVGLAAIDPGSPDSGLHETVIWTDEVVVAVPPGHRWALCNEIDREDFARTPTITRDPAANSSRVVEHALALAGLTQVPPLAQIGSTAAGRAAALAQGVPVLLSRDAMRDGSAGGLIARRVAGLRFERQFALILPGAVADLAPPARAFAEHVLRRAAG